MLQGLERATNTFGADLPEPAPRRTLLTRKNPASIGFVLTFGSGGPLGYLRYEPSGIAPTNP